MAQEDDLYKEFRDVWQDCNHRQEFEHDLINRKTTWSLTGQTILFAAYGVTLGSNLTNKSAEFRGVIEDYAKPGRIRNRGTLVLNVERPSDTPH